MSAFSSPALPGPLMIASGCAGTGRELAQWCDLGGVDFVTRTITLDAQRERLPRRVEESPSGWLWGVGVPNSGLEQFLATELPLLVRAGARVHVSVSARSAAEFVGLAIRLHHAPGVSGIELNLGQPDAERLGLLGSGDAAQMGAVVAAVRREFGRDRPVSVKLATVDADLAARAHAVRRAGASAVVLGHGIPASLRDGSPAVLSGPAIAPITLRAVGDLRRRLPDIEVIASGGVTDVASVHALLDAGAAAVQVGTALLRDPTAFDVLRTQLSTTTHRRNS